MRIQHQVVTTREQRRQRTVSGSCKGLTQGYALPARLKACQRAGLVRRADPPHLYPSRLSPDARMRWAPVGPQRRLRSIRLLRSLRRCRRFRENNSRHARDDDGVRASVLVALPLGHHGGPASQPKSPSRRRSIRPKTRRTPWACGRCSRLWAGLSACQSRQEPGRTLALLPPKSLVVDRLFRPLHPLTWHRSSAQSQDTRFVRPGSGRART